MSFLQVLSSLFQLRAPYPSSPSPSSSSSSSSITIHDIESRGGLDEISIVVSWMRMEEEEEEEKEEKIAILLSFFPRRNKSN